MEIYNGNEFLGVGSVEYLSVLEDLSRLLSLVTGSPVELMCEALGLDGTNNKTLDDALAARLSARTPGKMSSAFTLEKEGGAGWSIVSRLRNTRPYTPGLYVDTPSQNSRNWHQPVLRA